MSEIARRAGDLLLEGFRKTLAVRTKSSASDLVTEYDERSEAQIREGLERAFPGVAVVGEESGGKADGGAAFYVDPIDGTTNFAHGHPFFCISIGLWEGGEAQAGVVHAPAIGLLYKTQKGGGTTRNDEPCWVSRVADLESALLSTGFPADRRESADNNYREFTYLDARSHGVRRCAAAALELCLVADGSYDAFWDRGLSPWDLAAGVLCVQEAGGAVVDLHGEPFSLLGGGVVASNERLQTPLLDALAHARALPPIGELT